MQLCRVIPGPDDVDACAREQEHPQTDDRDCCDERAEEVKQNRISFWPRRLQARNDRESNPGDQRDSDSLDTRRL